MIGRKVEALEFKLGHGGYYAPAIKTYFEALSGSSHLRAVVVDDPDGRLFGVYNASDLIGSLRVAGDEGYRQFQELLNSGNEPARAELAKLPGFVGAASAVTSRTSKRDALRCTVFRLAGRPLPRATAFRFRPSGDLIDSFIECTSVE